MIAVPAALAAQVAEVGVSGPMEVVAPLASSRGTLTSLGLDSGTIAEVTPVGIATKAEDVQDSFFIHIPAGGAEHTIPGAFVRASDAAAGDVVASYANLLNVPVGQLSLWESDLREEFAAIRAEFSTLGFHERVLEKAKGFVAPTDFRTRDVELYRQHGSTLEVLAAWRRAEKAADRFNPVRCLEVFKDAPEFDALMRLAKDGIVLDAPVELVFPSIPEAPRRLEVKLQVAYTQHVVKLWGKLDGIVLPMGDLSEGDKALIWYSQTHMVPKPGGSRFIMDCSNSESGWVLNTPAVKEAVIARVGPVVYWTWPEIVEDWYAYADGLHVPLRECRLFKDDVQGAFAQMDINPASVRYLAVPLVEEMVLLYSVGLFGWLGFPMNFALFSRGLEWRLRRDLEISIKFYADDAIALALAARAEEAQTYIEKILEATFGSTGVSYDKKVPPCLEADVIGWGACLTTETFRPAAKGIRKLVFAFCMVAVGTVFPLVVYQMLASLADFYSLGVPGMKPFSYALHAMSAKFGEGDKCRFYKKAPSSAARLSIEVWRVAALLLLQKNPHMCRPLRSLLRTPPTAGRYTVITDGSPWGLGIGLYGPSGELVSYMAYQFPFVLSAYQNVREYLGYLLSFFLLEWVLGNTVTSREVLWIGDNEAALSWAAKNKCNSAAAQYGFLVITWLRLTSQFTFLDTQHQPGVLMGDIDSLSRGLPHGLDPTLEYKVSTMQLQRLNELFLALDPAIVRNLGEHHIVFSSAVTLARGLLTNH